MHLVGFIVSNLSRCTVTWAPRMYVTVNGVAFSLDSNLNPCSSGLVGYSTGNQLVKRLCYRGNTNTRVIPVQRQMKLVFSFPAYI